MTGLRRAAMSTGGLPFRIVTTCLIATLLVVLPFAWVALVGGNLPALGLPFLLAVFLSATFLYVPKETLIAFVLYVLFYETVALWTIESVKQVDELAVPIFFVITFVRMRPIKSGLLDPLREGALAGVVAIALASSLASGVPLDILLPGILLLVKGALLFYVVLWLRYDSGDVSLVVRIVGATGIAVLGLGLVEWINPSRFQDALHLAPLDQVRGGVRSVKSIFFHPVLFGWFNAFVGLYYFAYYSVFRKWWQLGLALLFVSGSIVSGRRKAIAGAFAALVAGVAVQFAHHRDVRTLVRVWAPAFLGLLIVGVVFLPYIADLGSNAVERYLPQGGRVQPSSAPAPSATPDGTPTPAFAPGTPPRVALYTASVDIARDYFPLGAGIGQYGSYLSKVHFSPLYERYGLTSLPGLRPANSSAITDTFWPQILGELGVFGLGLYVVFLARIAWAAWRSVRRAVEPSRRAFAFGALLVLFEALAESVAAPMFAAPSATYLVLGAVALSISVSQTELASGDIAQ